MSQFFVTAVGGTPVIPPEVPLMFNGNTGVAIAVLNELNVFGGTGINTTGSGDTLTISLANSGRATTTTVGATTNNVTIINLGATPSIGVFVCRVVGFDAGVSNNGVAYVLTRAAKTDGISATLVQDGTPLVFEDTAFDTANADVTVSGNNVRVSVTGVAGFTIDWVIETTFTAS